MYKISRIYRVCIWYCIPQYRNTSYKRRIYKLLESDAIYHHGQTQELVKVTACEIQINAPASTGTMYIFAEILTYISMTLLAQEEEELLPVPAVVNQQVDPNLHQPLPITQFYAACINSAFVARIRKQTLLQPHMTALYFNNEYICYHHSINMRRE